MTMVENEAERQALLAQLEAERHQVSHDLPTRSAHPCGHWDGQRRQHCERQPARRYMIGPRCLEHAPKHPFGYRGGS